MTALRGIREAAVLLLIAVTVAVIAALVWIGLSGGGFAGRLGICLIAIGLMLAITGDVALSRARTSDAFAWLGQGPERQGDGAGGGRALTGLGIFLFVAVPLTVIGILLAG